MMCPAQNCRNHRRDLGDAKFCPECGQKTQSPEPQSLTCPDSSCANQGKALGKMKFCPECGATTVASAIIAPKSSEIGFSGGAGGEPLQQPQVHLPADYAGYESGASSSVRNIIGGDQNITHSTVVHNQDQTKQVRQCAVSGRHAEVVKGHVCPGCGLWVHQDYFDAALKRCDSCCKAERQRSSEQFDSKVQEFLADGVITREELTELRAHGSRLGLSQGEQDAIIHWRKQESQRSATVQRPLSLIDQTRWKAALRFLNDPKAGPEMVTTVGVLDSLRMLHRTYQHNGLIAEGLVLMLCGFLQLRPTEVMSEIEAVLSAPCFDHDSPRKYLIRAVYYRYGGLLGHAQVQAEEEDKNFSEMQHQFSEGLRDAAASLEAMFPESDECHAIQGAIMIDSYHLCHDGQILGDANLLLEAAAGAAGDGDLGLALKRAQANVSEGGDWGREGAMSLGEGLAKIYFEALFNLTVVNLLPEKAPPKSAVPPSVSESNARKLRSVDGVVGKVLDVSLPGGKAMRFCYCPPGQFIMGSPLNEPGRDTDENQVSVTISQGFWMAETEVTQDQWQAVMGNNPSGFRGGSLPVENVSWDDAQEMVCKLNQVVRPPNGLKFALPSEAQWEYACRVGTQTAYSFGGELTKQDANYDSDQTVAVKSYRPNRWGLYDMHGNVWEWCEDWWVKRLQGGVDPVVAASGVLRVRRGGSWYRNAVYCRAARRGGVEPGFRDDDLGFRPALVPSK
jgi:sulfatase modifying factor 1